MLLRWALTAEGCVEEKGVWAAVVQQVAMRTRGVVHVVEVTQLLAEPVSER
jgi:hypothetical protein